MRMLPLSVPALLLCASASWAQSAPAVEHYPRAQLEEAVAAAASAPTRMMAKPLGSRGSYSYIVVRRDQPGEVEVHDVWDDVVVVQSGAGTMLHGGVVSGGRQTAPGETRGGEIRGGTTRAIAAGDVVVVPAGVPHQVRVAPGESITYFIVKAQPGSPPAQR